MNRHCGMLDPTAPFGGKGTFKYHMTLREGDGCLLKPSEYHHIGGWPNRHITFIVVKKLNLQFILLY